MIGDVPNRGSGGTFFSNHAFLRLDSEGRVLQSCNRAAEILGRGMKDLVGCCFWSLLPSSLNPALKEEADRAVAQQSHLCHETFDARLGSWLEYHICPVGGGFEVFILDVTERQRAEVARKRAECDRRRRLEEQCRVDALEKDSLKEAQERLRMALETARMATWEFDVVSGRFRFSESLKQALGVAPEDAPQTALDVEGWVVPEDYEPLRQCVEQAVNAGEEYVSEFRIRDPGTGEVRWLENRGHSQKDENGRPLRLHGMIQDISGRKRYEMEIERLAAFPEESPHPVLRILADGRIDYANPASRPLLGAWNRNVGDRLPDEWFRYIQESLRTGSVCEQEIVCRENRRFSCVISPVSESGYVNIYSRDITEQYHIEQALRRSQDELESRVRERTAELDAANLILRKAEERLRALNAALERRAEQLRYLTIELTQAEERERRRIAQMLHDHLQQLLVGAKFSLGAVFMQAAERIRPALDGISNLLDQSISACRSLTAELVPPMLYEKGLPEALQWLVRWMREKHGIEVVLEVGEWPGKIAVEARILLFQAIRELLFNVVKHARVRQAGVSLHYGDGMTVARVRDEGVGFDPQAQDTDLLKSSGGFGLIALRERLAAMGGQLEIESSPGHGTRAMARLPARPEKAEAVYEPVPVPITSQAAGVPPAAGLCRVVIADDHTIVRQGFVRLLQEIPEMDVIGEAENGQRAIELTKSLRPDVVVMDVSMPRMNGIEATRIIHRELPDVRIVGLSMYDTADAGRAMMDAGAAAFLPKDAPVERLITAIREISGIEG